MSAACPRRSATWSRPSRSAAASFSTAPSAHVRAVAGVSLRHRAAARRLGLVGESGCGKSTLGRCIVRLIEPTAGEIRYRGERHRQARRSRRCARCAATSRSSSRTPTPRCIRACASGDIIAEPLRLLGLPGRRRGARVAELLRLVRLDPEHAARYPHELSGGQRQRVGIARALALEPRIAGARRAGLGARRLHPGRRDQPAARAAESGRRVPAARAAG